jgi:hypothetical protein
VRYLFFFLVLLSFLSTALRAQTIFSRSDRCAMAVSAPAKAVDPITLAQVSTQDPMQVPDPQFGRERQKDPSEEKLEHDREKALNKQRQTNLQKDTDRLLQLATELKQYVDKTNEHTLSLDVVKKADEIEKLAKSVKDKMKGSY